MSAITNLSRCISFTFCILSSTYPSFAQTPEEHASHHPGQADAASSDSTDPGPKMVGMGSSDGNNSVSGTGGPPAGVGGGPPAGAGGMMGGGAGGGGMMGGKGGGMGGMMEKMGAPKPRDLYPTLMNLSELTPEKKAEVLEQAGERIDTGLALMGEGFDTLSTAAATENHAAMQEAVATVREGLTRLDSGLAARRAIAEGKTPRNVALKWFKREMNLLPPEANASDQPMGGSVFHLFTMTLLIAFALAMLLLYYFKMRRAAALFARVEPGEGPPPPGSIPPLAGKPGPSGAKSTAKPGADVDKDDKATVAAAGEKSTPSASPNKGSKSKKGKPSAGKPPKVS